MKNTYRNERPYAAMKTRPDMIILYINIPLYGKPNF